MCLPGRVLWLASAKQPMRPQVLPQAGHKPEQEGRLRLEAGV